METITTWNNKNNLDYSLHSEDLQPTSDLHSSVNNSKGRLTSARLVVVGNYDQKLVLGRGGSSTVKIGRRNRQISRAHVSIEFNTQLGQFQLTILGLNGASVDHVVYNQHAIVVLEDHSFIDVLGDHIEFRIPPRLRDEQALMLESLQDEKTAAREIQDEKKGSIEEGWQKSQELKSEELRKESQEEKQKEKQKEKRKEQKKELQEEKQEELREGPEIQQKEKSIEEPIEEPIEEQKEEPIEEQKEEPIEEQKEPIQEQKEEPVQEQKEETKDKQKEEPKDETKESKEEPKEEPKGEPKEELKDVEMEEGEDDDDEKLSEMEEPDYSEVIIDALVFSRTSSMPVSDICSRIMKSNPSYAEQSRELWIERIREVLKEKPFFGEIQRKGKTADGSPKENLYYYNSELDPVEWRKATYTQVGRSARKCTLKDKQYFWKIPPKLGRHRSSYIPPPAGLSESKKRSRQDHGENSDPKKTKL